MKSPMPDLRVSETLSLFLLLGLAFLPGFQSLAGTAPVQTYFIPGDEGQLRTTFLGAYSGAGRDVWSVISISPGSANTLIYFDHHENGYEADIANPASLYSATNRSGTQVWGDNNAANGIPPGFATDLIGPGKVIVLTNSIPVPRAAGSVYFDGGDIVAATRGVELTRISWPVDPGPVLADAIEVYDTRSYGTNFVAPVGINACTSQPYPMFSYSALAIMPAEDDTVVQVDTNANGTFDLTVTLDKGESYLANNAGNIKAGAEIRASKPVQVHLFTGRRNSKYQSRWFTLDARERWSTNYYAPVGTTDYYTPVGVVLFNPYTNTLSVSYKTKTTSAGVKNIAARSTSLLILPDESGAVFSANRPFTGVNVVDVPTPYANNNGDDYDWGCTLLTENALTPSILVGYGAGSSDLSGNGSPVWVMALQPTTLFVDYDANPATGPLIDGNRNRYDVRYTVTDYQSKRIFNNSGSNNQTGMRVYTTNGVKIVAAWGEDADTATTGNPYLDAGTTIFGLPDISGSKSAQLAMDQNGNGKCEPGDEILYTLRVNNEGGGELKNVVLLDPLPSNTVYVAGSATFNGAPYADNAAPALTPYPFDETGISLAPIASFSSITFEFKLRVGHPFPASDSSILNTATASSPAGRIVMSTTMPVIQADLALAKSVSRSFVLPETPFLYTLTVTNKGPQAVTNVTVGDSLPDGITFVSGGSGAYTPATGIWTIGPLNPGTSATLQFTVRADRSGIFTNAAEIASSSLADPNSTPSNGIPSENDYASVVVTSGVPALVLIKTAEPAEDGALLYVRPGTNVSYAYRLINSGDTFLANIVVTDNILGGVGTLPGPLAPGSTSTLHATHFNLTDSIVNLGTATATPCFVDGTPIPDVPPVTGADSAAVQVVDPSVSLVLVAGDAPDGTDYCTLKGSGVPYLYRVANTGDTGLTNVCVTDNVLGDVGALAGVLSPGETRFFTRSNSCVIGSITNLGTVTGQPCLADGTPLPAMPPVTDTDDAVVNVFLPALGLIKTAGNAPDGAVLVVLPGSNVVYTYQVINRSDTFLANIAVTDNVLGAVGTIPGPLAPGASSMLHATHFNLTHSVVNMGLASAIPCFENGAPIPNLPTVTDLDPASVVVSRPAIQLTKTAGDAAPGEILHILPGGNLVYSYEVVVTGDAALTNVTITDDVLGVIGVLPGPLNPGSTHRLQKTHLALNASVTNIAVATGWPVNGLPPVTARDDAFVRVVNPAVSIVQLAGDAPDGTVYCTLRGSRVPYRYLVANTGDICLTNVCIGDDKLGCVGTLPGVLHPGESLCLFGTNASVLNSVTNLGTVTGQPCLSTGTPLSNLAPVSDTDDAIVNVYLPALELVKTAGAAEDGAVLYVQPGANVAYAYRLANRGDTFLTAIAVTDTVLGVVGFIPGPVEPGWSTNLTATHSNLLADVINVAEVRAVASFGDGSAIPGVGIVTARDEAEARVASLMVKKEDTPDPVRPGQSLSYTLWVANPSAHPVTDVRVAEQYPALFTFASSVPAPASGQNTWLLGDLAPGAIIPIVINGTVSAGARKNEILTNRVAVTSANGGAHEAVETTRVMSPTPSGRSEIRVTKRDDADPVSPGSALTYTIRVENFGPSPAKNVTVTETYDPLFAYSASVPAPAAGSSNVWSLGRLEPNTFAEITVAGLVSPSAPNGCLLHDSVVAAADNADPSTDAEVTLVGSPPPPDVRKTASLNPVLGGQTLIYTVTVANVSADAVVSNVSVVESYDPLFLYASSQPQPMGGVSNVWFLGDLPPGHTTNIVITGTASEKTRKEDLLFNTVEAISLSGSRTVHLTTRVINAPVIPVVLLYFRATTSAGGVRLKWATATEFDNLGFNLYRARSATGSRTRINTRLVPGAHAADGQIYRSMDPSAKPDVTYYYWLEEVGADYTTVTYGPAIRWGSAVGKPVDVRPPLGSFRTATTGGLYRIRYETLVATGLPMGALDASRLGVRIGGAPVPVFLDAMTETLQTGDSLLFYAKASKTGLACEVTLVDNPVRMKLRNAGLRHAPGDVYLARAGQKQRVRFITRPAIERYFLIDFTDTPVWILDITRPNDAVILTGYSYVGLTNGLTAVYLSYDPQSGPAKCLAVQDKAVIDVPRLEKPER